MNFILSSIGTSILTNIARKKGISAEPILRYSNVKAKEDVNSAEDVKKLEEIIYEAKKELKKASEGDAARLSAELNGILGIYKGEISKYKGDIHCLLCTDTWLGKETAEIVKEWLESKDLKAFVQSQKDLRTDSLESFRVALADLVLFCEEAVEKYREKGYRVIFNLTGGFKSVQGFLQTLAMFYADEACYIFESGNELLKIPRLPIKMDAKGMVLDNLTIFRRLSMGLSVSPNDLEKMPETFLFVVNGEATLSGWGELVWQRTKKEIYQEKLFEPPSSKIRFGEGFIGSVRGLEKDRYFKINEAIDKLARMIEKRGDNLNSLGFEKLRGNPCPPSTHEFRAWDDKDAKRIFGHYEEGSIFVLDILEKHL